MCGRITLAQMSWAEFRDWLVLRRTPEGPIANRFNVAPTATVPIVREGPEGPEGALARWGFVPEWHRGALADWKASTFNARAEDAATKPSFRDAWRRRRCVLLASGFYEWQVRAEGKQPHYIRPAGNAPALLLAGLWSEVRLPDYQGLTCTVLTEPAQGALAALHHRVPLMLEPGALRDWLDGRAPAELPRLPETALAIHPVSRRVNAVRNDGPELIEPIEA